jgi:capsule polysaccharide export protein KpsE/RkpR
MEAVLFSPAQMHLVTLMSHIKSEDALDQLRDQLADFYARQVDEEMEKLWESGEWNEQKLQSLQDAHFRTPYK